MCSRAHRSFSPVTGEILSSPTNSARVSSSALTTDVPKRQALLPIHGIQRQKGNKRKKGSYRYKVQKRTKRRKKKNGRVTIVYKSTLKRHAVTPPIHGINENKMQKRRKEELQQTGTISRCKIIRYDKINK